MPGKSLKPRDFVHLHNHTHYSLLDGLQKIEPMVQRAKKLGMDAIAMTDHGTLSGTIEFYKTAHENEIKPILGIETYVANRSHTDKDPAKDKARFHLILLAMNNEGYGNLIRLSTKANLDGFYHKPRIDHSLLEQHNGGLICLSGCIGGEIGELLRSGDKDGAEERASWYQSVFGDRYYLELQDHSHTWKEQAQVNKEIIKLASKLSIPLVVTGDAHYLTEDDQEAHEVLLCVQTGAFLSDKKRMSLTETDLYLSDPKDIIKRWQHVPQAITNTRQIADRCNVEIPLGGIHIPKFPLPEGESETQRLAQNVYSGLAMRYLPQKKLKDTEKIRKELTAEVVERAEFELDVINRMGFDGYFLIVADFVNWGKKQGIVFGPGRGSAAGSIVSYALNITDLDPLKYDLLFERFLNPDRISMPDIDIDIQDTRRDEVIEYCVKKYGQERVAHIVTFGTMAARNAIRDVARVLEVPYKDADRLAKMMPPPVQGRHIPLSVSVKENKELKEEYESNPASRRVIDLAIRLEGTIRSHGVHAAGVVITPSELLQYTPLEMAQKGVVTTQYAMGAVEELGLLKMDFLGLSNLTIVKNALRIIKKVEDIDIDIGSLPLDDKQTYQLLGRGETTGVFQLESSGMKRYLRDLQPAVFEDIIAMCALYRPGPLTAGLTDRFVRRKNGQEKVEYGHPAMKPSMEATYGVLVYQEQVMQFSKDVCGFSGGEADTLRKAIGKKKRDVMAKMQVKFIDGGVTHGKVPRKVMEKFWDDLMGFADYAFNKSHSACYAMIAYWTAYLKAHYPAAFMAALMTSDFDNTDRLAIEIQECATMGLSVLSPDINQSFGEFAVVPGTNQIRFGLSAIKNVGVGAVEAIIEVRDSGGDFFSIEDFAKRVSTQKVNRKTWESLIKAGAFDKFAPRGDILLSLDDILSFASRYHKDIASGQIDLFGTQLAVHQSHLQLKTNPSPASDKTILQWERELLGIYLSSHPLESYNVFLNKATRPISEISLKHDGEATTIGGIITTVREITTKNGQKMAFASIADMQGECEIIVFPNLYSELESHVAQDAIVIVHGKATTKDRVGQSTQEIKVLADEIIPVTDELMESKSWPTPRGRPLNKKESQPQSSNSTLYMKLQAVTDVELLGKIRHILEQYPGRDRAVIVTNTDGSKQAIQLPFGVGISDELVEKLSEIFETPESIAIR